jgi:hypothetical protein
MATLTENLNTI